MNPGSCGNYRLQAAPEYAAPTALGLCQYVQSDFYGAGSGTASLANNGGGLVCAFSNTGSQFALINCEGGPISYDAYIADPDGGAPPDPEPEEDAMTISCSTACTVTHTVDVNMPVLQLSLSEGAQIAGAILAVWAVAWGFRVLIQVLKHTDGNSTSESDS